MLLVISDNFLRNTFPDRNIEEVLPIRNTLFSWLGENCYSIRFPLVIIRWIDANRIAIVRAENPNDHLRVIRFLRRWEGYFEIGYRLIPYPDNRRPEFNLFYSLVDGRPWGNRFRNNLNLPPAAPQHALEDDQDEEVDEGNDEVDENIEVDNIDQLEQFDQLTTTASDNTAQASITIFSDSNGEGYFYVAFIIFQK